MRKNIQRILYSSSTKGGEKEKKEIKIHGIVRPIHCLPFNHIINSDEHCALCSHKHKQTNSNNYNKNSHQ